MIHSHKFSEARILVCGWKEDMGNFLKSAINGHEPFAPGAVAVIAAVDPACFESMKRENTALLNVSFISGACDDETVLRQSGAAVASTIVVLADESRPGARGSDIDARTLKTVAAIRSINRSARLCVEILDERLKPLLLDSHADEVVCAGELARRILGRGSVMTGFPAILSGLLSGMEQGTVYTARIPDEYQGQPFDALAAHFQESGELLAGLVENAVMPGASRSEAIREALKTPSVSRAVENLLKIKKMKTNVPVFNPGVGYIVPQNALAIVIGRSALPHAKRSKPYKRDPMDLPAARTLI
jgi:hypothetical protein